MRRSCETIGKVGVIKSDPVEAQCFKTFYGCNLQIFVLS
jgi:hypothetical protein